MKIRRSKSGKIAEFAPALFVMFFIALCPCLNLIWLATAYSIIGLAANQFASAAAVETTYDKALRAMHTAAISFNASPWLSFGGLAPVGGYSGVGSDLYLKSTNIASHAIDEFGPNTSVPPPVDSASNIWEYKTSARYSVRPLLNLSAVPFIGSVPGLGSPVTLTFVAHKLVEHPEGLAQIAGLVFASQPIGSIRPPGGTGGGGVLPGESAWYNPTIYDLIAAAGQTIVAEDVLQVFAVNSEWTDTGMDILPGQKVWIDLRADGSWHTGTVVTDESATLPLVSADGNPAFVVGWNGLTEGALIATLGDGAPFLVGRYQLNLSPPGTGRLKLLCNDGTPTEKGGASVFGDNVGQQVVRIIITE